MPARASPYLSLEVAGRLIFVQVSPTSFRTARVASRHHLSFFKTSLSPALSWRTASHADPPATSEPSTFAREKPFGSSIQCLPLENSETKPGKRAHRSIVVEPTFGRR